MRLFCLSAFMINYFDQQIHYLIYKNNIYYHNIPKREEIISFFILSNHPVFYPQKRFLKLLQAYKQFIICLLNLHYIFTRFLTFIFSSESNTIDPYIESHRKLI